jgi:uncharacterized protein (UPF0276 family)
MNDHPGNPGFGLGLRRPHYQHVLEQQPSGVDWFEVISENFLAPGGRPRSILRKVRENYPVVLHGLSFNIGTDEPLDTAYLDQLKALIQDIEPAWVSDHICWTGLHGRTSHDLLPIAYNEETLRLVSDRVNRIQDHLGQTIVLENPSTYLQFRSCEFHEADFINAMVDNTGCRILLDVNNVYVSSFNLGFDPQQYIDILKTDCVQQFHLAGHTNNTTHIVDTHDHPVCDEVWSLYHHACQRFGAVATLLERDDHIPPFDELLQELNQARALQAEALADKTRVQQS